MTPSNPSPNNSVEAAGAPREGALRVPRWSGRLAAVCLLGGLAAQDSERPTGPHWSVLPGRPEAERVRGFEAIAREGSRADLPVLRDLLRFATTADEWYRILDTGTAILGEDLREVEGPWRTLSLRMAGQEGWPERADYGRWKAELYATKVDPRMRRFFDTLDGARIPLHEIVWGGVEVDGIPSLDRPQVVAAHEADFLSPDEPVFGVSVGDAHRAYPLRILDWHEMANDSLGGVSFALAYCTLCGSGIVFRTDGPDGTALQFGSSGLLMRSNKLMFDRGTHSLWNQFTGEPVLGPAVATAEPLATLPSVVTTWGAWQKRHPDTDVVSLETGVERDYGLGASYGGYFGSETLMFPAAGRDPSRFAKERVFVVRGAGDPIVVPLDVLRRRGVMQLGEGDEAVVLLTPELPLEAALPESLKAVLEELGREIPQAASKLPGPDLMAALGRSRAFLADLEPSFLLALPAAVRLPFLREATEPVDPSAERLPVFVRNEVALRGLAGEVFAYRGEVDLVRQVEADGHVRFTDAAGRSYRAGSEALHRVGPGDPVRYPRVSGHLAFRFGVEAFLPGARWVASGPR